MAVVYLGDVLELLFVPMQPSLQSGAALVCQAWSFVHIRLREWHDLQDWNIVSKDLST